MKKSRQKNSFTDRSDRTLALYLKDISRYPLLTEEESLRLARIIRQGGPEAETARKRFIEANLRYVVTVAKSYNFSIVPLMDIISEGILGLIQAVDTYDVSLGYKFTSYADPVIRHAIEDSLGILSSVVPQPSSQQQTIREYNRMNDKMMQLYQRPLSIEEFCENTGSKRDTLLKALSASQQSISLDAPLKVGEEEDIDCTLGARLSGTVRTDSALDRESIPIEIQGIMSKTLSNKEMYVLRNSMGMEGEEYSLESLSDELHVTTDRVRQIKNQAQTKLKASRYADRLRELLAA